MSLLGGLGDNAQPARTLGGAVRTAQGRVVGGRTVVSVGRRVVLELLPVQCWSMAQFHPVSSLLPSGLGGVQDDAADSARPQSGAG